VALSRVREHHRSGDRGEPTTRAGSSETATEADVRGIDPGKGVKEDCRRVGRKTSSSGLSIAEEALNKSPSCHSRARGNPEKQTLTGSPPARGRHNQRFPEKPADSLPTAGDRKAERQTTAVSVDEKINLSQFSSFFHTVPDR
jgi:hypothetical protein